MVESLLSSSPVAVSYSASILFIISLLLVTFVSKVLQLLSQKRTRQDIAAQQDSIAPQEPPI